MKMILKNQGNGGNPVKKNLVTDIRDVNVINIAIFAVLLKETVH
jgi:hypothetical protein